MSTTPRSCDVAVLTVIGPELHAVLRVFGLKGDKDRKRFDGALYWEALLPSTFVHRPLRIGIGVIGDAGTDEAAARAAWLRAHFQPAAILLVGIAAGRRDKIKIGDVLVSRGIVDHTRQVAIDGEMLPRTSAPPLAFAIKQMLAAYRHDLQEFQALALQLFGREFVCPAGREEEFARHVAQTPVVADGEIASANTLLRDPAVLEKLSREVHQGTKIGEMEAAGVARACNHGRMPIPWLIIRGVSDFGDDFKSDAFHEWASCTAAAYTRQFLEKAFDLQLLRDEVPNPSLEKLERLTTIGMDDAAYVQRASGSTQDDLQLGDLYATRKMELEVLNETKPADALKKKARTSQSQ